MARQVCCTVHTNLLTACTILGTSQTAALASSLIPVVNDTDYLGLQGAMHCRGFAPRMLHMAGALLVHISHPA